MFDPQTSNFPLLVLALFSWGLMNTSCMLFPAAAVRILAARCPQAWLHCRSLPWASVERIPTCVILESSSLIHAGLSLSFLKHSVQNRPRFSRSAKYSRGTISINMIDVELTSQGATPRHWRILNLRSIETSDLFILVTASCLSVVCLRLTSLPLGKILDFFLRISLDSALSK